MKFYQPLNIDSTKIAVTSTATSLFDLMNTAGSTSEQRAGYPQEANTLVLSVEDGSIRVSLDGTSPTADEGLLLTAGTYTISCDLDLIELIRVGGTNVNCSVAIGESINGADMTASPVSNNGGTSGGATLAEQETQTGKLTDIETAVDTQTTKYQKFNGVGYDVTEVSETNPLPTVAIAKDPNGNNILSDDYGYSRDTSFVTGDSPTTVNMSSGLGRNAKTVQVFNDGAGDLDVSFSSDGSTFGTAIRILGSTNSPTTIGEAFSFDNLNVSHVRFTWVADTSYRVFYQ